MAQMDTVPSERINLRLSETAKRRIEQAAVVRRACWTPISVVRC